MPDVTFEIDRKTGAMTVDIHGIVGPACDNVQRMIEELTGSPAHVDKKPEYHQRVVRTSRTGR